MASGVLGVSMDADQRRRLPLSPEFMTFNSSRMVNRLACKTWLEVMEQGSMLVAWVNQERATARLHPPLIIALCVVVFLEVHPFQDGNGRLSRVLTTLLLLQAGYA